ncbi:malic enzyme-like NAD(P)-binding protein [Yersinia aleksiciae]
MAVSALLKPIVQCNNVYIFPGIGLAQ